ncbi:MAG TPA: hypothetical protein DDW20_00275 [Firmicutes bacterium]|nr:hypothetical protein [Bacillota bacterium]
MKNNKTIDIKIDNTIYSVKIFYKQQKGIYLRYKNEQFVCTSPFFVDDSRLIKFFKKAIPSLNKKISKKSNKESPIGEDYTYLLGEKIDKVLSQSVLFDIAYKKLIELTRKYEKLMNIVPPYNVRIKIMNGRYGSNSLKTHSISYQLDLIHYSEDIIASVVIHELAHHFHRNHQKAFYKCVLKYCPDYYERKKKLRKGIYK